MPWIIIVILVVLLTFAVQIYRFLFPFAFGIEQFLGLLLRPVDKLTDLFLRRESGLPGAKFIRFIILGIVLVASVIFIFTSLSSGTTFDDISDIMLGSTSIGQLFAFFGEERFGSTVKEQFTFTALVSLGLSSFLSFLYMRCTIETIEDFGMPGVVNFLFVVLFNLAFICISALLSAEISDLCTVASDKLMVLRETLSGWYHSGFDGFFNSLKVIFGGFFLLILYAAGIYLLVVTAREMVASLNYGFMSLLLTIVVAVFWTMIPEVFPNAPQWILSGSTILLNITLPIAMFLPDYIRATDGIKILLREAYLN